MSEAARLVVRETDAGQRLDRYLAADGNWGSRAQVQKLIVGGAVRVDGQTAKAGCALKQGQTITVDAVSQAPASTLEPAPIPLAILYEDEWLLVIDKPAGLVVHPAPGHWQGTLVSALLHHWGGTRPGLDPLRPGIVHRLDKDTSGVLVIAKDARTLAHLGAQFRNREVEKEYLAVVWGRVDRREGEISTPIGRHPVERKRMAVRARGRAAHTRFEVVRHLGSFTLLRLFPRTGRTHQLRVHLASIGHPVVGDPVYGKGRRQAGAHPIERQALHARRVVFRHPQSGEKLEFCASAPADIQALCGNDESRAPGPDGARTSA